MTLHVEPPAPAAGSGGGYELPTLVIRLNKLPRVPLWYWFRYPRRALWITLLIRESFRWRDSPNAIPQALTWGEKALLERARRAREKAVADVADRLDRLADRYHALCAEAVRERKLAEAARRRRYIPKIKIPVYAAGPTSVQQAETIIAKCKERIAEDTARGQTRHQERPSKARGAMTVVPLLVDIVALLSVIAKFFNVTPKNALDKFPEAAAAVGFALLASMVLALLAHSVGHAAWHLRAAGGAVPRSGGSDDAPEPSDSRRHPPANDRREEFPSTNLVLYSKLISLFVVSAMVGVTVAFRVIQPTADVNTGLTGYALGVLLGFLAFLAPWVIVNNLMRSGSLEVRTIEAVTTMIRDAEASVASHEKSAAQAEEQASLVRGSSEQVTFRSLDNAMGMAELACKIIELARSQHGQAGRFALDDNAEIGKPFLSMRDVLAVNTDAIDQARARFSDSEEKPVAEENLDQDDES